MSRTLATAAPQPYSAKYQPPTSPSLIKNLQSLRDLLAEDGDDSADSAYSYGHNNHYNKNNTNYAYGGNTACSSPVEVEVDSDAFQNLLISKPVTKIESPAPSRGDSRNKASASPPSADEQRGRNRSRRSKKTSRKEGRRQRTMSEPPTFRARRLGHSSKAKKQELESIRRRLFQSGAVQTTPQAVSQQNSHAAASTNSPRPNLHAQAQLSGSTARIEGDLKKSSATASKTTTTTTTTQLTRSNHTNVVRKLAASAESRAKKLNNFFGGEPFAADVAIKEIEQNGLKALLASKVPVAYFLFSVVQDMSSENLMFYLEAEAYERTDFHSLASQMEAAATIVDMFLTSSSYFELNLESRTKKSTLERIQIAFSLDAKDPTAATERQQCFSECKSATVKIMEDSYRKFRLGPLHQAMKNDLGEGPAYTEAMRRKAATLLTTLLQPDSARVAILKRHIRKFCQRMLLTDFEDGTLNLKPYTPSSKSSSPRRHVKRV